MSRLAVIPARYASTRFSGKPLTLLLGKPMIQHVFDRCQESRIFDRIIIATDDARIAHAAAAFGAEAVMTSAACATGTDRAAEVARSVDADVIINVQGDEPALSPASLQLLAQPFDEGMATLVRPLRHDERTNPNVVKAVLDESGRALYFSRADLPFERAAATAARWAHVGLYAYRRETLLKLAALPPTALEKAEHLEQLRALGAGIRILCRVTAHASTGVDTPDDVPRAEAALRAMGVG